MSAGPAAHDVSVAAKPKFALNLHGEEVPRRRWRE